MLKEISTQNFLLRLLAIISVILSALPFRLMGFNILIPMMDVIIIFFWTLYRPSSIPNWFIFLLGIIYDSLTGLPLGTYALINLALRNLLFLLRDKYIKLPFATIWLHFSLWLGGVLLLQWLILVFVYEHLITFNPAIIHWIVTVLAYPILHSLFAFINYLLPNKMV